MSARYYVSKETENGSTIHYSDIEENPYYVRDSKGDWAGPDVARKRAVQFTLIDECCYSDYSGSAVERSNHRTMHEAFPWLVSVIGSHGSNGLGYLGAWDNQSKALREAIGALSDYPLFDEEDHSALESDMEIEAWADHGESDFRKALVRVLDTLDPDFEDRHEIADGVDLFEIWREGCDAYNVNGGSGYTIETGSTVYFYIDEWADKAQRPEDPRYPWSDWARKARAALEEKLTALALASRVEE